MHKASLDFQPVIVIAMYPPTQEPAMAVGFVEDSPVGPCVAMGVSCALSGQPGLAFIGHLHPDEAEALCAKLQEAIPLARAALNGGDLRIPQPVAAAAVEAYEQNPGGPGIIAVEGTVTGEAMAVHCQIQKPLPHPATDQPGTIAISAQAAPCGTPVILLHLGHPDGDSLHAVMPAEVFRSFFQLQELAVEELGALTSGGAPEGVQPS